MIGVFSFTIGFMKIKYWSLVSPYKYVPPYKCPRVIMIYTYENIGVLISCIDQKLAIWLMQEIEGCAVGYKQR